MLFSTLRSDVRCPCLRSLLFACKVYSQILFYFPHGPKYVYSILILSWPYNNCHVKCTSVLVDSAQLNNWTTYLRSVLLILCNLAETAKHDLWIGPVSRYSILGGISIHNAFRVLESFLSLICHVRNINKWIYSIVINIFTLSVYIPLCLHWKYVTFDF